MAMEQNMTLISLKDSAKLIKENRNEGKKIAVWSKKGKTLVTSDDYFNLSRNNQFDIVECPYDDFNNNGESKKRNRKSYERTKNAVDHCFAQDIDKEKKVWKFQLRGDNSQIKQTSKLNMKRKLYSKLR